MTLDRDVLTDVQWARLAPLMPGGCKGKRGPRTDNRLFLDAVLWMTQAGGRWKDRPERFGKIGTVKRCYDDWMARSVLADILAVLAEKADREWVCVDATIVRAHQQAAGARREEGALIQGLGRLILSLPKDPRRPEHQYSHRLRRGSPTPCGCWQVPASRARCCARPN